SDEAEAAPQTVAQIAESDFAVETVRLKRGYKPSKAKASAGLIRLDTALPEFELLPKFGHRVWPASQWDAMKAYKSFVIKDEKISIRDHIYIKRGEFEEAGDDDEDQQP